MSTEQQLHPTADFFRQTADEVAPVPAEQQAPAIRVNFSQQFNASAGPGLSLSDMQPLPDGLNDGISPEEQRIGMQMLASNINDTSGRLNDKPEGIVAVAPKAPTYESDLCFGIGSVLGVTKEALGIEDPSREAAADMDMQQRNFNPVLNPFLRPSPSGSMGMA